ncbi:MAG: two-component regulator propeller domain-containing protein [Saprospiraceae bacterium]|nr:histidine kinase [Lewinella sp.]
MKGICLIICCLLLLQSRWVTAQETFSFDHPVRIDDRMGLPSNMVNALVQDHEGFLWIGTQDGLVRFDGHRLQVFQHDRRDAGSLQNDRIESLLVDHKNRLWVGTSQGLYHYDSEDQCFLPIDGKKYPKAGEILNTQRILSLFEDDQQQLWIGTTTFLACYHSQQDSMEVFTFSVKYPDTTFDATRINVVHRIAQDKLIPDKLWVGTLSGLIRFDRLSKAYDFFPNIMEDKDQQYLANSIKALHPLPNGRIMVGSWAGTYVFQPSAAVYSSIPLPQRYHSFLTRLTVNSFIAEPNGRRIGITHREGFSWYDPETGRLGPDYHNAPPQTVYSAQWVDRQNRIWGISDFGVFQYNPLINRIKLHNFPAGTEHFAALPRAALEDPERNRLLIVALSMNGVLSWEMDRDHWSVIPSPADLPDQAGFQHILRLQNGRIVLIANHKLYELLPASNRIIPLLPQVDFGTPAFRSAVEGAPNELWIGSRRAGLFRIDLEKGTFRTYAEELDKVPGDNRHQWIEQVYKDNRGQIWFRTAFEYSVYLPREDRFYHWDSYGRDSIRNLPVVLAFQEDRQGRMWLAGERYGLGLASVDDVDAGVIRVVNQVDGQLLQSVEDIGLDHQGKLWLEHEEGITRYDPETDQKRYFGAGYGVPATVLGLIHSLPDGRILLGRSGGVATFRPEDLFSNKELPIPYLTAFKIFEQEPDGMPAAERLKEIKLSYKKNFFSFEFSALAFNLPEHVRFRYRLEGFDQQWNEAGQRRYAAYTNIPGGDYVFTLQAANNEGIWNTNALQIPISITTPWWRSLWFWIPTALLFIGMVIFAVRWRIRQVRAQEQIKADFDKQLAGMELNALRAQMNPHFIFNCLNSIDYYIIKNETEKASDYLNRFSKLIRLILQNSRAEYVNLKDELEALKLYMEMESLRFDDRFEYVVRVGSGMQLENIEIPPLLLQPYVENAIWHGLAKKSNGKNRLDLTITSQNGLLHCRIEDNGIGREAAQKMKSETTSTHRSMGMYITRDRLSALSKIQPSKADVRITDLKHEDGTAAGTRVEISIPIR